MKSIICIGLFLLGSMLMTGCRNKAEHVIVIHASDYKGASITAIQKYANSIAILFATQQAILKNPELIKTLGNAAESGDYVSLLEKAMHTSSSALDVTITFNAENIETARSLAQIYEINLRHALELNFNTDLSWGSKYRPAEPVSRAEDVIPSTLDKPTLDERSPH